MSQDLHLKKEIADHQLWRNSLTSLKIESVGVNWKEGVLLGSKETIAELHLKSIESLSLKSGMTGSTT